jgi:Spy/CpxP family protein refolding chaperone
MWDKLRTPVLALSIGLNLAFAGIWLVHTMPGQSGGKETPGNSAGTTAVPSALHREIGVTEEQWGEIAPHVRDFREAAAKQRQRLGLLRGQLLDLLSLPDVDDAAIRSKQEEILAGQRRMQDLVIDHLLLEKDILSPDQAKRLVQSIREQCRRDRGAASGKGIGRFLEGTSSAGVPGGENTE